MKYNHFYFVRIPDTTISNITYPKALKLYKESIEKYPEKPCGVFFMVERTSLYLGEGDIQERDRLVLLG